MTRHLLIDSDPGIDDALAILLALRSSDARVEAVTTVAGNVAVDRATANARRILAVAAPDPPPPSPAARRAPLKRALVTAHQVHGAGRAREPRALRGAQWPPALPRADLRH